MNCKKYIKYNAKYDGFLKGHEDVIIADEKEDRHYCPMFDKLYEGIPSGIWKNKKQCPYFVKKEV